MDSGDRLMKKEKKKHIFMCLFTIHVSSKKCFVNCPLFSNFHFVLFSSVFRSSLYILDSNSWSVICVMNIFAQLVTYLFVFLCYTQIINFNIIKFEF